VAVDQPLGLRVRTDNGGRQQTGHGRDLYQSVNGDINREWRIVNGESTQPRVTIRLAGNRARRRAVFRIAK
jgi:hypothetical protein